MSSEIYRARACDARAVSKKKSKKSEPSMHPKKVLPEQSDLTQGYLS